MKLLRCLAAVFLMVGWGGMGRVAAASADVEYAALQALYEKGVSPLPAGMKRDSAEEWAYNNGIWIQVHERGLAFFNQNSRDPRRWQVLIWMSVTPTFFKEDGGQKTRERDVARQLEWGRRHLELLEQLLTASDANDKVTQGALSQLLIWHAMNWRSRATTEGGMIVLAKMEAWFARYRKDYPKSLAIPDAARALADVMAEADPYRCQRWLEALRRDYASDKQPDPRMREMIDGRLKILVGKGSPVLATLGRMSGGTVDPKNYAKKLVLIVVLPVTWAREMEFNHAVYNQHHAAGLEVVQVSGNEESTQSTLTNLTTVEGRRAAEKRQPWRIVWEKERTIGEFSRSLGGVGFPRWLLIGRDGIVIGEKSSARETMAMIEAALAQERGGLKGGATTL